MKLDIRDWRADLGSYGKLHVRFGKGSRGRGPKPRLVPAINGVDQLMDWWLAEVRPQYGHDWADPDAPLLPSERFDRDLDRCGRVGANALRRGLAIQVDQWLPAWSGRMTPARAAALLRLVALRRRHGHQGAPRAPRPPVAGDHLGLHPCPQRPHRAAWNSANDRIEARLGLQTDYSTGKEGMI